MNQEHQTLTERRLLLLQEIAERADEIKRIDDELRKPITGDCHVYDGIDPDDRNR